ncbi:MAG: MBL fold metallo-hydrolase [bacterium]
MKFQLLPSAAGKQSVVQYATSLLIDDRVLIDAGTAGFFLERDQLAKITDIFISHTHMDHVASLPSLLEACLGYGLKVPNIWGSADTQKHIREFIFNNYVWPDFFEVIINGRPVIDFQVMNDLEDISVGDLHIRPIPVDHVIPTHGFLVKSANSTLLISSDTGPTEEIWRIANALERLDAVILEVSFDNATEKLALAAKHLTPAMFHAEIAKITRHQPQVFAVHLKPWSRETIIHELNAAGIPQLSIMESGKDYFLA